MFDVFECKEMDVSQQFVQCCPFKDYLSVLSVWSNTGATVGPAMVMQWAEKWLCCGADVACFQPADQLCICYSHMTTVL